MLRFRLPTLSEIFGLFWKSRSVASATAAFRSTVERLEEVSAFHNKQSSLKATRAQQLAAQSAAHVAEANAATNVASKVKALIS